MTQYETRADQLATKPQSAQLQSDRLSIMLNCSCKEAVSDDLIGLNSKDRWRIPLDIGSALCDSHLLLFFLIIFQLYQKIIKAKIPAL